MRRLHRLAWLFLLGGLGGGCTLPFDVGLLDASDGSDASPFDGAFDGAGADTPGVDGPVLDALPLDGAMDTGDGGPDAGDPCGIGLDLAPRLEVRAPTSHSARGSWVRDPVTHICIRRLTDGDLTVAAGEALSPDGRALLVQSASTGSVRRLSLDTLALGPTITSLPSSARLAWERTAGTPVLAANRGWSVYRANTETGSASVISPEAAFLTDLRAGHEAPSFAREFVSADRSTFAMYLPFTTPMTDQAGELVIASDESTVRWTIAASPRWLDVDPPASLSASGDLAFMVHCTVSGGVGRMAFYRRGVPVPELRDVSCSDHDVSLVRWADGTEGALLRDDGEVYSRDADGLEALVVDLRPQAGTQAGAFPYQPRALPGAGRDGWAALAGDGVCTVDYESGVPCTASIPHHGRIVLVELAGERRILELGGHGTESPGRELHLTASPELDHFYFGSERGGVTEVYEMVLPGGPPR
jgi:hypothetical protein